MSVESALNQSTKMLHAGASILDIGGYSSRPNAEHISAAVEINRVVPVIESLRDKFPEVLISIDTFRGDVAYAALQAGANMVNDISGGAADDTMYDVVAEAQVPYCMMHMKGTPQTMIRETTYNHLIQEILGFFSERVYAARKKGVRDIILDPGFGFAKNSQQNFELLNQLEIFKVFELPILVGVSRKSMIYTTLGIDPDKALNGTTVLNTLALRNGASILRVHDIPEAQEVIALLDQIQNN